MPRLILIMVMIVFALSNSHCYAQYSHVNDSLINKTATNLSLKLEYKPLQLQINSLEIHHATQPIFVYNQAGMHEHYNILDNKSQLTIPYKAYYPSGIISYVGNNRRRDSFNPHGVDDIGSALLNGFINGILLGHKY
ncbi:hypothetical protein [Carboxylicivirga marina]|uniref:Uncharacterized protein n=1 Tax=Carboxylicivirga marina TaxID=2800988 RepID=A0ABS1HLS6_9BACT|nr:hypothetical protein [Carboxylicivirga marina]MBK3518627.1 hypothetical protein [Carboxylicivirga marina]